ncbi:hypothetical protein FRC01_006720 [Tulasnella sp. 417]|nr:hypothetical protein FRC01_006720 [Tulasnella sp. 417]
MEGPCLANSQGQITQAPASGSLSTNDVAAASIQPHQLLHIEAMPVEIFQIVIRIVMEEYLSRPISRYYQALMWMRLVCRRWAVILEETTELWARLSPDMDERLIDLALLRSKQSLLTITGEGLLSSPGVDKLLQNIHRWRALDVSYLDSYTTNHLSVHPAPLLEELKLGPSFFGHPIVLFSGSVPMLRIVHIRPYGVQWSTSMFSNLQELDLSRIRQGGPDVDTFLHILTNSPMLTRLRVQDTLFTDSLPSQTRVRLSHLRDLELEDLEQDILKQLVDAIDIPMSTNCFFSVALINPVMHDNYPLLEPIAQRLRELANVSRGTRSTLTVGGQLSGLNHDLTMTYKGEAGQHGSVAVRVVPISRLAVVAEHFVRQLAQRVPHPVPPALHFIYPPDTGYTNSYQNRILREVGDQLPGTEEIRIDDPNNWDLSITLDLLFPRTNSHRLFPRLSTLMIRTGGHGRWAHWLQRRQERRVKGGGVYALPLQTLIVEGGHIKLGR